MATVTDDAEAAEPQVPTVPLPAETLVMDMETGRQVLRVDGFMQLPAGARIELGSMMDLRLGPGRQVAERRLWRAPIPYSDPDQPTRRLVAS